MQQFLALGARHLAPLNEGGIRGLAGRIDIVGISCRDASNGTIVGRRVALERISRTTRVALAVDKMRQGLSLERRKQLFDVLQIGVQV